MPSRENDKPLGLPDFFQKQGSNPASVLFVRISNKDLVDGRPACDPFETDAKKVLERVRKWWQLSSYVAGWQADPSHSPGLLVGLWGTPRERLVFASVRIDQTQWGNVEHNDEIPELVSLPVIEPSNVDAFELRHRSLAYPNITFGTIRPQHFSIRDPASNAF